MPEFAALCERLVKCQYQGLKLALVGTGEFSLTEPHAQLCTSKVQWMEMTAKSKNKDIEILTQPEPYTDPIKVQHGPRPLAFLSL